MQDLRELAVLDQAGKDLDHVSDAGVGVSAIFGDARATKHMSFDPQTGEDSGGDRRAVDRFRRPLTLSL
ncbi:hypothetical protein ACIP6I_12410 [Streptomyces anulatus]